MTKIDDSVREQVETTLRQVEDPQIGMNVFQAGLIDDLRVTDGEVIIDVDLTRFNPGAIEDIVETLLSAVTSIPDVERAHIEPGEPSQNDRVSITEIGSVIAVASTKGGVGKTTVAVGLAAALAESHDVGLLDADLFGPNVPRLLDVQGSIRADEHDRPLPVSIGNLEVMSVGFMADDGPLAWRGAMAHDALSELLAETAWTDPETLVIDLPPGTSDVVLTTLQEVPVDAVVFVTTPFHTSVADTRRSLRLFEENGVPTLGMVVNMNQFICEDCNHSHELFPSKIPIDELDVPVLAQLPFSTEFQEAPRPGSISETFTSLARSVTARLDELESIDIPSNPVDLRGLHPDRRYDRVREAFTSLDAGDPLYIVSDRDPTPAGKFLVGLAGETGDPEDVLPEFVVERKGLDEWALLARHP
ncbi:P-loop NTPase [Haladaptatus sp. NG-SE-30]